MSPEMRSALMSRIRGKNTLPERTVFKALRAKGLTFKRHDQSLPGRPDVVFRHARLAIFIDGDFWHGWRYPAWKHKLTPFWCRKIEGNRIRDKLNFAKLRRAGWTVIRLWEHQIENDLDKSIEIIMTRLRKVDVMLNT